MHIVAWLLTQRAIETGNWAGPRAAGRNGGLAMRPTAIPPSSTQLPPAAQRLIGSSIDLYARVKRLDEGRLGRRAARARRAR